jgi:transcriptional regulator with XRE-family HTH domain
LILIDAASLSLRNHWRTKGSSVARSESPSHIEASARRPVGAIRYDEGGRLPHESEFLAELGNRVREMRTLRGMSRRELARRAGLSERYVALIEVGKGNVSIVRLLRIALAFRCEQRRAVPASCTGPISSRLLPRAVVADDVGNDGRHHQGTADESP